MSTVIGTIEDIFEDGYVKFKVEDSIEYLELPINLFRNPQLDGRYKLNICEIPSVDRTRENWNYKTIMK